MLAPHVLAGEILACPALAGSRGESYEGECRATIGPIGWIFDARGLAVKTWNTEKAQPSLSPEGTTAGLSKSRDDEGS